MPNKEIKPMSPLGRGGQSFAGYGKSQGSEKGLRFDPSKMTPEDLKRHLAENAEKRYEKNIYNAEDLNEEELEVLIHQHAGHLNEKLFNRFKPQWHLSKNEALALQLGKDDYEEKTSVLSGTAQAYKLAAISDDIDPYITFDQHVKLLCFYSYVDDLLQRDYLKVVHGVEDKAFEKEKINLEPKMKEALKKFIMEKRVVSILKDAEGIYADVAKLADKYAIRLGDGKYFVASDEVQITFRDPSDQPAWAIWFMKAVPLQKVPDRGKLALLPEEERKKYMPDQISDRPIVCHASLWKLGEVSGVMLHTSWNHISVSYRWKIDKPIEIASILFKAVSHPAHIARNFGYAPQMRVPGEDWF
jgi:hypothetical protein